MDDCTSDAALARALADNDEQIADEEEQTVVPQVGSRKRSPRLAASTSAEAPVATGSSNGGSGKGKSPVRPSKQPRIGSAAAELAAVIPFARHVERQRTRLMLVLPEKHELVSASTYRVLAWGGGSHRETIRSHAPGLHAHVSAAATAGESVLPLDGPQLSAYRAEWDELPYVVPTIPPRDGHVYVTHESGEKLSAGGELYHRIFIEEQARPKEIPLEAYEARLAENKVSWTAGKAAKPDPNADPNRPEPQP